MNEIVICMGSSCYSRGNADLLGVLEKWIEKNNRNEQVFLKGCLCMESCSNGPHIRINGKIYENASLDTVIEALEWNGARV
ncbi:MAG: NAD(P)H-dependent oxidoreductase subunit E [Spirochaetia bacterium]